MRVVFAILLAPLSAVFGFSTKWVKSDSETLLERHRRLVEGEEDCVEDPEEFLNSQVGNTTDPNSLWVALAGVGVDVSEIASNYEQYDLTVNQDAFDQEAETFGRNGEHTKELLMQHALCQIFWNMADESNVEEIWLAGVHSEGLADLDNVINSLRHFYVETHDINITNETEAVILQNAQTIQRSIETELPGAYTNPWLTQTALADTFFGGNVFGNITPPVILLGDGTLESLDALELGDIASDFIHAHEFAHILQYIVLFENLGEDEEIPEETPSETRRTELQADALASYFLAHEQGRNFQLEPLMDVAEAAFVVGDCDVTDPGHHGTPEQRRCATMWGANQGVPDEPVIPFRDLMIRFNESLPLILELDPSVCGMIATDPPEPSQDTTSAGEKVPKSSVLTFVMTAMVVVMHIVVN